MSTTSAELLITCTNTGTSTECNIKDFGGFFLPFYAILSILILLLFIKIFEFKNPWKN